jgi:hypothetical protein
LPKLLKLLKNKLKRLIEDPDNDEGTTARLHAYQGKTAGAWLSAYPSKVMGLKLNDNQARIAIGHRLGADIEEAHDCICGARVEKNGHHGLACKKSTGRHPRHSMLNDIVKRALASAGQPSCLEPVGLTRTGGKRADGVTMTPWFRGACLAWDATVVDALAPSNITRSSTTPGHAAEAAEVKKTAKYHELVERGYIFQPVAFEVQGRAGPETETFLSKLGRKIKEATHNKKAHFELLQRISIAIQMGNAASVMGTLPESHRESLDDLE